MPTVRYTTVNGEVIAEKRSGVRRLYVPDPLGSTVALLDNTQAQTDTFAYWPYGEERVRTGTTATPLRFVGTLGYYRDGSVRVYVRARTLDKAKGRWLTPDPIGLSGGDWNLLRYVWNKPITLADPSGLDVVGRRGSVGGFGGIPCCWKVHDTCYGLCCGGIAACPPRKAVVPPFAAEYGKCCGYDYKAVCLGIDKPLTKGKDCIDEACCQHDCCTPTLESCFEAGRFKRCQEDLCRRARACLKTGCKNAADPFACRSVAWQIERVFCAEKRLL